jgi:ABC-2 type transport system permease protein
MSTTTTAMPRTRRASGRGGVLASLVGVGWRSALVLRGEVVVGTIALLARVVLVVLVWRAVYGDREAVDGVTREAAVAYAVLGAVLNSILNPFQRTTLERRVRTGQVAIDMLRPVPLIPQTLAQQIGTTASAAPRAIAALLLGLALGALAPPAGGVLGWIAVVVSVSAGVAIALVANLIVSMTSFWTTDVGGAMLIYRTVVQFASGSLIPLWFMPDWLRAGLELLPFQAQVFVPLSIYFGETSGWDAVGAIAGQLAWIAGLGLVAHLVWRRAERRVVVHGG